MFDVVIVGGGPAGLSAALILGRCRRNVLVVDAGKPRNAASRSLNGYLTRDGIAPLEFLGAARDELRRYGIVPRATVVTGIACADTGFRVTLENDEIVESRTVLVATGVRDKVPDIPGLEECYGTTVHHCPYCDGWEHRDRAIVVLGRGAAVTGLALSLKTWSDNITICTDGRARIPTRLRTQLAAERIDVYEQPIASIEHHDGRVRRVIFRDRDPLLCEAIFFSTGQHPKGDLPRQLGCAMTRKGIVKTDHLGHTRVPGVYVAGDASRDVQFVVVAAAEGAKAGVAINKALQAQAGRTVDAALRTDA